MESCSDEEHFLYLFGLPYLLEVKILKKDLFTLRSKDKQILIQNSF